MVFNNFQKDAEDILRSLPDRTHPDAAGGQSTKPEGQAGDTSSSSSNKGESQEQNSKSSTS